MTVLQIAAFAALVAAVAGLYLLKPPPRRWVVPSSFIWEQVLRQTRVVVDRWRWWMSLLLACVIACLIGWALLQSTGLSAGGKGRLVLVVDDSATMATRTADGQTRFQHALARARVLVRQNSSVLVTDTAGWVSAPSFAERQDALAALERMQVSFVREARFPDIAQMTTEPELVRAVFITDGVAIPVLPPGVEVESVFEPAFNVGITAFDVKPVPGEDTRAQALIEVSNAAPQAVPAEIELADRRGHHAVARVSVAALQTAATMIDVSGFDGGPVAARVRSPGDALALDDVAYAWMPSLKIITVGLVTAGSPYLEQALRHTPRVRLTVMAPGGFSPAAKVDAWVFDRFAPRAAPVQPSLLFRPPETNWLPKRSGELTAPAARSWNAAHPVLENLSMKDVIIDTALRLLAGDENVVLLKDAQQQPLMLAKETDPRRVIVGFALEDSNFPLEAGFPVFLANTLHWLTAEPVARMRSLGPVMVPLSGARVVGMDGKEVPTFAAPQGTVFTPAEPGLFTAVARESVERIAVNVFEPRVTQVNGSRLPPMKEASVEVPRGAAWSPWRALLLLALLLLALEWWTWNRRVTV